jgi:hypothetical protein
MTVREQLAEQASRPRPRLERTCTSLARPGARKILTLPLDREITLTARMLDPEPFRKLITVGGVNATEMCGIPAHHLLITRVWVDAPNVGCLTATSDHIVYIELLDSPSPLKGSPEVDFDALLDALDGELVAPPSGSWHDRPGLL